MTQDRHGEINDNTTLMLANAQHPLKRMDRSNVMTRVTGVIPFVHVGAMIVRYPADTEPTIELEGFTFPAGVWFPKEDE